MKIKFETLKTKRAKIGSYTLAMVAIAAGIAIAVTILADSLPKNLTQFDISAQRLYSVISNTKVVVNNLKKDIDIYWITQSGKEDTTIEKLLNVYDAMSDRVTVTKKNPDVYPTFASEYTDDTVNNNSLVVVCGDRFRYIDYNDIYDADTSDYYAGKGSVSYSFDGEGEITSAINYVVSEKLPQVYLTTGHGEGELSDKIKESVTRANMETKDFSLLNVNEIPEEADVIMINSPTSDFSENEVNMLQDYVKNGGKLMVISGPQKDNELLNLRALVTNYGVTFADGIVLEEDREHYGFNYPYILIPDIKESPITTSLSEKKHYVLVPLAEGMQIKNAEGATVTSLLSTSDTAFSKVSGYDMSTSEREDSDISGPFSVAISVEESNGGKIVYVSSDTLLSDEMVSYSSGANSDFAMNALSWMTGDDSGVAIASKSMSYSNLTISEAQANIIRIVLLGVLPLGYLLMGIDTLIFRRKKQ